MEVCYTDAPERRVDGGANVPRGPFQPDLESNGVPTAADSRKCGWCSHWLEGCGECGICGIRVAEVNARNCAEKLIECMTMYEDGEGCAYYLEVE